MIASRIEVRAVLKVVAIVLVALGVALLLQHVIVEVRTTFRWVFWSTSSSASGSGVARFRAGPRRWSPT